MNRSFSILALLAMAAACAGDGEPGAEQMALLSAGPFVPAAQGCAMAHCDGQMSDAVNLPAPVGRRTHIRWHDRRPAGSALGLGCVSNGSRAACTYLNPFRDNLVVYDADGERLWTSGTLLEATAVASAAMIDDDGGVIAVDDERAIRFDPDGDVVWNRLHGGEGTPISPVLTASGVIVLATAGGGVVSIDPGTGDPLRTLEGLEGWDTINTPGVRGDRIYVSMQNGDAGRLAAIDVSAGGDFTAAEAFDFRAVSGASPLVIEDRIYFDGYDCVAHDSGGGCQRDAPHAFAVRDTGDGLELMWRKRLITPVVASFARDPRGGVWHFELGRRHLFRRDESTGALLQTIDVDALMGDPTQTHVPASVTSIAMNPVIGPVMILSARPLSASSASVVAIALRGGVKLWDVELHGALINSTAAQFAIVRDARGFSTVVFPGAWDGAYGVGL